jgi:hypothetical protein
MLFASSAFAAVDAWTTTISPMPAFLTTSTISRTSPACTRTLLRVYFFFPHPLQKLTHASSVVPSISSFNHLGPTSPRAAASGSSSTFRSPPSRPRIRRPLSAVARLTS